MRRVLLLRVHEVEVSATLCAQCGERVGLAELLPGLSLLIERDESSPQHSRLHVTNCAKRRQKRKGQAE